MSEKNIRVGLLGFGVVGQGAWKHMEAGGDGLERLLGVRVELVKASARNLDKKRGVEIPPEKLTTDSWEIVNDPEIDLVCELMGGIEPARELTMAAIAKGKHVVTANKALICEHGAEIFSAAEKAGVHYGFEASVAGGIPIIKTIRESLVANEFRLIYGILNGTSNYILTRMEQEGASFDEVLGAARDLGYVEADEALDLDGYDAAHKTVILAYLAHGLWAREGSFPIEGIRRISTEDLQAARKLDCKVKLIAVIRRDFETEGVALGVYPALVPMREVIAHTDGVYNGISVTGNVLGTTVLTGRGAGQDPTASSVISDVVDAIKVVLGEKPPPRLRHTSEGDCRLAAPSEIEGAFYLRLTVEDKPGQLARVADTLADQEVSIATVLQTGIPEREAASIILTTHETNEHSIAMAIQELEGLQGMLDKPVLLRMFDPNNHDAK